MSNNDKSTNYNDKHQNTEFMSKSLNNFFRKHPPPPAYKTKTITLISRRSNKKRETLPAVCECVAN